MKKFVIAYAIIFFTLVNTTYFWIQLSGWDFLLGIFYMLLWFGLVILLLVHIVFMLLQKFKIKQTNINASILGLVFIYAFYFPVGIIDYEKQLHGKDKFVAGREGSAICMTYIKLKDNQRFYKEISCFGFNRFRGSYTINADTIWFTYDEIPSNDAQHTFGILYKKGDKSYLHYRSFAKDTMVLPLEVYFNELEVLSNYSTIKK